MPYTWRGSAGSAGWTPEVLIKELNVKGVWRMAIVHYMKDGSPATREALGLQPKPHGSKKDRRKARKALKNFALIQEKQKESIVEEVLHGKTPVS